MRSSGEGRGGRATWQLYEHEADVGVRGVGATPEEAFAMAARAMTAVVTDPADVRAIEAVDVECRAADRELLLVEWLNCLVFEMSTRRLLFSRFDVRIDEAAGGLRLRARAWGEAVDVARHAPAVEVKGATLTTLSVSERPGGGWVAQTVVDC